MSLEIRGGKNFQICCVLNSSWREMGRSVNRKNLHIKKYFSGQHDHRIALQRLQPSWYWWKNLQEYTVHGFILYTCGLKWELTSLGIGIHCISSWLSATRPAVSKPQGNLSLPGGAQIVLLRCGSFFSRSPGRNALGIHIYAATQPSGMHGHQSECLERPFQPKYSYRRLLLPIHFWQPPPLPVYDKIIFGTVIVLI